MLDFVVFVYTVLLSLIVPSFKNMYNSFDKYLDHPLCASDACHVIHDTKHK